MVRIKRKFQQIPNSVGKERNTYIGSLKSKALMKVTCSCCNSCVSYEEAHIVSHLKIICSNCYKELNEKVISVEDWLSLRRSEILKIKR
ncbi:hypothetical protein HRbin06_00719 [archaeon HR06]|nr:hypothetical protein HRbin06_00719 [archaeon HR06]